MPAGAASTTCPPAQKLVGPSGVIVASGSAFTITSVGAAEVAAHPFASTMVTEYEPVLVTVIDGVVAPFDQL